MKEVAPLASCTGCIPVIKDGEDGIGIMDANVLFAISSSGSMPPEDTADWKDTYAELPFSLSSFLWACTRITYTNKTSKLTGKYCVGACKDLASVTELYALGDSNINPPSGGWSQKFTPTKGKWLWTKNELTFSNGKMAETTPVCICYFGNDGVNGTKFTPKGTAYGHYTASSKMPKPSDDIAGLLYLVDKVDNPLSPVNSPCTAYWRSFSDNSYMLSYDAAEEGDAYNVDGTLWVHNGTVWKDFGSIQGPKGDDGKDALWTILTPDAVMFESDDNGAVKASSKDVVIRVYRGREIVTSKCKFSILAASDSHFDVESYAKLADSAVEGTKTLTINSKGIGTKTVAGINVSYPTSYVYLHITYDGNSFMATIKILVDTTAVDGYFRTSVKGLEAKYTSVETVVNNSAATLKTHETLIQANANEIKKRVTETTFNAGLDQIQSNVSNVDQKADKISQTVERIDNLTSEWYNSGVVTKANFLSMFSETLASDGTVMKRAEMSTYVQKDDNGYLQSGVKVKADNIILEGIVTANGGFKIKEDGSMECHGANVSGIFTSYDPTTGNKITIDASEGKILLEGPSKIDSNGLPTADAITISLAQLWFATDKTNRKRYAQIRFDASEGGQDIWVDALKGVRIEDGAGSVTIGFTGISYWSADNKTVFKSWEELLS